jgi:hypothetical protein
MGIFSSIGKALGKVAGVVGTAFGGPVGGVLSSAAGSLIDNKLTKDRENSARAYQDPAAIRARYEAAGFNPLLAFNGNGAGTIAPSVGQSTTASSLISAALDRDQDREIATAQLEQENRRLELMAEELALKATPRPVLGNVTGRVGGGVKAAAEAGGTVPPLQGPAYPGPQQGPAPADDPTEIMRGDGLTSATSAEDGPVEAEGDLWAWGRNGTLSRNIDEMLARNFGNFWRMDQQNWDTGQTLQQRLGRWRDNANRELEKGRERRKPISHPVFRSTYPSGHRAPGF